MRPPKVVVAGTIALDDVRTPFGSVENALGGSASYATLASSLFAKTGISGIIGGDFPKEHIKLFLSKGIDISGIEVSEKKSFHWKGFYGPDLNDAKTLHTELDVLGDFSGELPDHFSSADYLFLANIEPEMQLRILSNMQKRPKIVVADTMNLWISTKRKKVLEVVDAADICLMNEGEARMLFDTNNVVKASKKILERDLDYAIIKKGEYGCVMFSKNSHFALPGYPLENVRDPTGSGDCFGGSLIGYLSRSGDFSFNNLRKAIVYASCVASKNAEDFSVNALQKMTKKDISKRYGEFREFVRF